jgi:trk system potassium uptake protein TrkA
VQLAEVHASPAWVGEKISRLQEETGVRVAFLTRLGEAMLPSSQTVLQEGDLVHVMMRTDDVEKVEATFAEGPEREAGH